MNKITEPVVLSSPGPLDDGGRKFNIAYPACIVVLCLIFCVDSGINSSNLAIGVLCGAAAGWFVKWAILNFKVGGYRTMKFQIDNKLPYDILIQRLIPVLVPMGMTVEKDSDGSPVITFKGMIYDLQYSEDPNTFTLWWRYSIIRALATGKGVTIGGYRKIVTGMGIIAYYVQQSCKGNSHGEANTNKVYGNNVRSFTSKIKCSNCDSEINSESKFCINCGAEVKKDNFSNGEDIDNTEKNDYSYTCPCCGAKVKKGDKFCIKCGKSLDTEAE